MAEYKVQFEMFEGPLDLLLYLVRKQEVDIYEVNLTTLATDFIEYVEIMRELDLEVAGEFLVMAATLMYIKSKELLPVEKQVEVEGDEEEDLDPRWELIRQLVQYKKFKDVATQLEHRAETLEGMYPRNPPKPRFETDERGLSPGVSIFDLVNAVNDVLKRFDESRQETRGIVEDRWTVSGKIDSIRKALEERGQILFSELFGDAGNRTEVVVTFLAMLELIRLKIMTVEQSASFSEIVITKMDPEEAARMRAEAGEVDEEEAEEVELDFGAEPDANETTTQE